MIVLLLLLNNTGFAQNNPLANKKAIVQSGDFRFTLLTDGLVRIEWDSLQNFMDRPSLLVINRNLPVPHFTTKETSKTLYITTSKMSILLNKCLAGINNKGITISFVNNGEQITWQPGMKDDKNLKGTYRTLDGYNGNIKQNDGTEVPLEDGILSRNGWTAIDDSKNLLFTNDEWPWVESRQNSNARDIYFFAYGTNYKKAIYDYTLIAGKIPLPPKYVFGYWWSRYWNYSDTEIRSLAKRFIDYKIPVDVFVVDMDWHTTTGFGTVNGVTKKDKLGQRLGWTGYTWNRNYFPDPQKLLTDLKGNHIKTTLNLHPASGMPATEEKYNAFAKAYGFDTTGRAQIPFEATDKKFITTLFDTVLHPLEKQGINFWWLDWQQWPYSKNYPTLNNVWWLNYMFFTDMQRQGIQRPLLYHRWGGLGNHRYQVGFSGDAVISWKSLAYQPYFTTTASNVLYGYWSHDIGGHMLGSKEGDLQLVDPELYVRWMQFGAFSPILRTHSTKDSRIKKEPWNFAPVYRDILEQTVRDRYKFSPYIYTMARRAFDTGISICSPLYYDYPLKDEAYQYKAEYMFGEDILIAPITSAAENNLSKIKVWLPEGNDWYEYATGNLLKGGQVVERSFLLDEYPVFVKAGSVLTLAAEGTSNLQERSDKYVLFITPGNKIGKTALYEDDGNNDEYKTGKYTLTEFESNSTELRSVKLKLGARKGAFLGMGNARTVEIQMPADRIPALITLNKKEIPYSADKKVGTWYFSASDFLIHVLLPSEQPDQKTDVEFKFDTDIKINGLIGRFHRLHTAIAYLKEHWRAAYLIPDEIIATDLIPTQIEYNIQDYNKLLNSLELKQTEIFKLVNDSNCDIEVKAQLKRYLTD